MNIHLLATPLIIQQQNQQQNAVQGSPQAFYLAFTAFFSSSSGFIFGKQKNALEALLRAFRIAHKP